MGQHPVNALPTVALGEGPVLVALEHPSHLPAKLTIARRLGGDLRRNVVLLRVAHCCETPEALMEALGASPADLAGMILRTGTGEPVAEILRAARELAAALVLVGLPGQESNAPITGGTLEQLLSEAPCPVLLTPPRLPEGWSQKGGLLVPLDGSPSTAAVVPIATELAEVLSGRLEILHVAAPPGAEAGGMSVPLYVDQPQHEWATWRREFLSRFCECHWHGRPPVETRLHVGNGPPAEAILSAAEAQDAALIVLGWHGRLANGRAAVFRAVMYSTRRPILACRVPS